MGAATGVLFGKEFVFVVEKLFEGNEFEWAGFEGTGLLNPELLNPGLLKLELTG